ALLAFPAPALATNSEDAARVVVVDAEAEVIDAHARRGGKQGEKLGARTDAQSCVCVGLRQDWQPEQTLIEVDGSPDVRNAERDMIEPANLQARGFLRQQAGRRKQRRARH